MSAIWDSKIAIFVSRAVSWDSSFVFLRGWEINYFGGLRLRRKDAGEWGGRFTYDILGFEWGAW